MDPLVVLFGLAVGVLIGLTGVGGGSLMTPLLLLVGGYSPVVTIGTDLAYGAVTKTFGGWRHLRAGHIDLRLLWWLAAGSVPGALAGVAGLRHALGIILAAAALGVLTKAGVSLSPVALVGIPAALAGVSVAVHRRRVGGRVAG